MHEDSGSKTRKSDNVLEIIMPALYFSYIRIWAYSYATVSLIVIMESVASGHRHLTAYNYTLL